MTLRWLAARARARAAASSVRAAITLPSAPRPQRAAFAVAVAAFVVAATVGLVQMLSIWHALTPPSMDSLGLARRHAARNDWSARRRNIAPRSRSIGSTVAASCRWSRRSAGSATTRRPSPPSSVPFGIGRTMPGSRRSWRAPCWRRVARARRSRRPIVPSVSIPRPRSIASIAATFSSVCSATTRRSPSSSARSPSIRRSRVPGSAPALHASLAASGRRRSRHCARPSSSRPISSPRTTGSARRTSRRPTTRGRGKISRGAPHRSRRSGGAAESRTRLPASRRGEHAVTAGAITSAPRPLALGRPFVDPVFDFAVIGGGLSLITFAALWATGALHERAFSTASIPWILPVANACHFAATTVRLYTKPGAFDDLPFLTMVFPLATLVALTLAIAFSGVVGAHLYALYLTWSPYHYAAQAYGLAAMYAMRSGRPLADSERRLLWWSCMLPFVFAFAVGVDSGAGWLAPSSLLSGSGADATRTALERAVAVAAFAAPIAVAWRVQRRTGVALPLISLVVVLTNAIWWVVFPADRRLRLGDGVPRRPISGDRDGLPRARPPAERRAGRRPRRAGAAVLWACLLLGYALFEVWPYAYVLGGFTLAQSSLLCAAMINHPSLHRRPRDLARPPRPQSAHRGRCSLSSRPGSGVRGSRPEFSCSRSMCCRSTALRPRPPRSAGAGCAAPDAAVSRRAGVVDRGAALLPRRRGDTRRCRRQRRGGRPARGRRWDTHGRRDRRCRRGARTLERGVVVDRGGDGAAAAHGASRCGSRPCRAAVVHLRDPAADDRDAGRVSRPASTRSTSRPSPPSRS